MFNGYENEWWEGWDEGFDVGMEAGERAVRKAARDGLLKPKDQGGMNPLWTPDTSSG